MSGVFLMHAIVLVLLTAAVALADPESRAEHKRATDLVKQLGHPRYAVREAAAKQLLEMGPTAVPALTAGTRADDEEVRNRSVALLPQVKAIQWKRRADAYLADTEGKQKHDLPMLAAWEKLTGRPDPGTRKLFADMVRTNGELLEAIADPKAKRTLVADRVRTLLAQLKGPKGQIKAEVGDLAAVLFADAITPPRKVDWSNRAFPGQLLANPTWREAIDAKDVGPVLRRLLVKWMDARPAQDYAAAQQFASLAQRKPFPEAAPVLIRLAKDKKNDVLGVRMLAVQALGKVGGDEAKAALAELVSDTTSLFGGGGAIENRLGDSALAALLTLHGKNLTDYGMTNNFGIGFSTGDGDEMISLTLHGFPNPAARARAVEKWKKEAGARSGERQKK
jgi:hypothetical protein